MIIHPFGVCSWLVELAIQMVVDDRFDFPVIKGLMIPFFVNRLLGILPIVFDESILKDESRRGEYFLFPPDHIFPGVLAKKSIGLIGTCPLIHIAINI